MHCLKLEFFASYIELKFGSLYRNWLDIEAGGLFESKY